MTRHPQVYNGMIVSITRAFAVPASASVPHAAGDNTPPLRNQRPVDMFGFIKRYLSNDLAIDLGTANTLIYARGKGIVLDEPSVAAIRTDAGHGERRTMTAVGRAARQMLGKVPGNMQAIRPLKDGVIADLSVTEKMLKEFVRIAHPGSVFSPNPRVLVCVPCGSTQVERRALRDSALAAGAAEVHLIEEPVAAAIGAGLPVSEATGSMVADIGGGTTEVGVISLGGLVHAHSLRVGGDRFDEAIIAYIRRNYGMLIGESTAEQIKKEIGSAFPDGQMKSLEVKGRNLAEGIPRAFRINANEIREAMAAPISQIIMAIKAVLEETPPEIAADISERGIMLTGGSALIPGIDRLVAEETGLPAMISDDPLTCVVRGCGLALERIDDMGGIFANE